MQPVGFEFTGFNRELLAQLVEKIKEGLKGYEFESFLVGCTFEDYLSEEAKTILKKKFQPLLVKHLEKELKAKADFKSPEVQILVNFNQDLIFFLVRSVYISGRYKKYIALPQTKHYCFKCKGKGCDYCNYKGVLSEESVEELIAKHAMQAFDAPQAKLHGAGREDIDVRMLGPGREFVLEIIEPKKRNVDLKKLEKEINKAEKGKIEVIALQYCAKEKIAELKAKRSDKVYLASVECSKEVSDKELKKLIGAYAVEQRTPLRVLQRRADIVRKKKVTILEAKKKDKLIELKIRAESGLYVKEFISGDEGRTKPSVSELLNASCQCKQLDVIDIID
jgi:tRNA pseudouridine synthase 10